MLETTPRHWKGVVCVWIEGCTLALMQSNQREILGIASHALMNWHSGFSGLAAITRVGSGVRSLRGGASGGGDWARRKSSSCKRMLLMNTLRPTHFTILRQLEGSCTGRGASSRVSLTCPRRPRSRGLLRYSGCNNYSMTMLYDLVEHHVKGRKQLV